MQDVFALEKDTVIPAGDSYVASYPFLISYFKALKPIGVADLVRGAHMAYGWMPRVLTLNMREYGDLKQGSEILNSVKEQGKISLSELKSLSSLINNSVVGASKLLHFVQPQYFPIWDSNLYTFVYEKPAYSYRVNSSETYLKFFGLMNRMAEKEEAKYLAMSVSYKIGYDITPIRAMELVMFLNSRQQINKL